MLEDFKEKTIKEIRLWSWAAAVLPITALAAVFFVWKFFDSTILGWVMIVGETIMFSIAVIWWWWAMYILRNLIKHWDETRSRIIGVKTDITEIKKIVSEVLKQEDK